MTETPVSPERDLALSIQKDIDEILSEWRGAKEPIKVPEPVKYPSDFVLEKWDPDVAANAFTGAFEDGDICFLVSNRNFEENVLTKTEFKRPSRDTEGYAVFTIFPSNFKSKCQERGKTQKSAVRNAMIDALWRDAQLTVHAKKGEKKRAQSKVKGKVGIQTI